MPNRVLHTLSPYLTGACIEDVNHEVYGGIDSQMIFGESFQEPCPGDDNVSGMWRPVQTRHGPGTIRLRPNETLPRLAEPADDVRPRRGRSRHREQRAQALGHVLSRGQALRRTALVQSGQAETTVFVSLESCDGSRSYAEAKLTVPPGRLAADALRVDAVANRQVRPLRRQAKRARAASRWAMRSCSPANGDDSRACPFARTWPRDSLVAGPDRSASRRLHGQRPRVSLEEDDRPARSPPALQRLLVSHARRTAGASSISSTSARRPESSASPT